VFKLQLLETPFPDRSFVSLPPTWRIPFDPSMWAHLKNPDAARISGGVWLIKRLEFIAPPFVAISGCEKPFFPSSS